MDQINRGRKMGEVKGFTDSHLGPILLAARTGDLGLIRNL